MPVSWRRLLLLSPAWAQGMMRARFSSVLTGYDLQVEGAPVPLPHMCRRLISCLCHRILLVYSRSQDASKPGLTTNFKTATFYYQFDHGLQPTVASATGEESADNISIIFGNLQSVMCYHNRYHQVTHINISPFLQLHSSKSHLSTQPSPPAVI